VIAFGDKNYFFGLCHCITRIDEFSVLEAYEYSKYCDIVGGRWKTLNKNCGMFLCVQKIWVNKVEFGIKFDPQTPLDTPSYLTYLKIVFIDHFFLSIFIQKLPFMLRGRS